MECNFVGLFRVMVLWVGDIVERISFNFLEYNKWVVVNFLFEEDFLIYVNINRKFIIYW